MDESRKAFEQWYLLNWGHTEDNHETLFETGPDDDSYYRLGVRLAYEAWTASRAAIEIELLADKRRMDWLVSKAVNVRDPMVYGSHSMFWSQAITDEEDDYYETKLREQIDAAMDAEKPSAPLESK